LADPVAGPSGGARIGLAACRAAFLAGAAINLIGIRAGVVDQ